MGAAENRFAGMEESGKIRSFTLNKPKLSMSFLTAMDFTLPLADPVLKFLIILLIILGAPLLLNKFRIPPFLWK